MKRKLKQIPWHLQQDEDRIREMNEATTNEFKKLKEKYKHTTDLYHILNKKEAIAWKRLFKHISNASLIIKFQISSDICGVITDYSIGIIIACHICKYHTLFFNVNQNEAIECNNDKCSELLINRWCDKCKEYYTISKHDYKHVYICMGCRARLCPRDKCTKKVCVNKNCTNITECLCNGCEKLVKYFDSYACGPCEVCNKLICGECYSISSICENHIQAGNHKMGYSTKLNKMIYIPGDNHQMIYIPRVYRRQ